MSRSTSGSNTSSDLAKGKKFLKKLLYVQHVDKEKETASEIPDRYLEAFSKADPYNYADSNFPEYLKSPKENLSLLKSSMGDGIRTVTVYSNPLDIRFQLKDVTIHAFVVFKTENHLNHKCTWWSLEKNGTYMVLQQSSNKDDVINKIYDTETRTSVERLEPIKKEIVDELSYFWSFGIFDRVENVLRIIWETNQLSNRYNLLFSNCQNFASFVFEKLSHGRKKWSTKTSAIVDRFASREKKKIQPKIKVDAFKYKTILNDDKFDCYWAMMEGRSKDFKKLINNLTIESLNSVDSQGNTLLGWATVFSSSDWPIDKKLKVRGAEFSLDEKLLKQNLFFIALQYLPENKKSKFLSFDGIDIHGVANKTGDTALHLALNGEKWEIAEEILNQFKDDDINITNSVGDTPLLLAARLDCEIGLFKKILNRTNSENVNKTDGNGNTALHYVILHQSKIATKELLARSDVNVDIKNKDHESALLLASTMRMNFPSDLFKLILEKSADVNAQDINGWNALHWAIRRQSEIMTKKLLAHNDVNVNVKNNYNRTALHFSCWWTDIPVDLFKLILEKSTSDIINAQDEDGNTALHCAILHKSKIATKALLAHKDVDVSTALSYVSEWEDIPSDLFKLIKEKESQ